MTVFYKNKTTSRLCSVLVIFSLSAALSKAKKSLEKLNDTFQKIVDAGQELIGTGSGKVPILLPAP